MVILDMSLCVYVCVVVEGIYNSEIGYFGNEPFCIYIYCCRGYLHM